LTTTLGHQDTQEADAQRILKRRFCLSLTVKPVKSSPGIRDAEAPWQSAGAGHQRGVLMAKKNRPSVLKRQREAEKRERQARRAAKAARKRERRMQSRTEPRADSDEDPSDTPPS
jgi:hypothetical protein